MTMDLTKVSSFTAEDFRKRASLHIAQETRKYGDHLLNPEIGSELYTDTLRDAAVLVPVIDREDGATVLLTQRASHLRNHPGQIAFPGGRIDPEDKTACDAALRETQEEVGLDPTHIEVVGHMPYYLSGSGFRIQPVLSVVNPDFHLTINRQEVDEAFEVPLAFLMDPANHQRGSRRFQGRERFYFTMPYERHFIWGITAGILHMIYERLYHR